MPSRRSTASFRNVGYWALRIQPSSALSVYAATGTTAETAGRVVKLPRMQLERQFAGPLQDTIIQRWRDPVDGTICYIYLPITAAHSPPTASGYVQYRLDKLPRGRSGRRGTRRRRTSSDQATARHRHRRSNAPNLAFSSVATSSTTSNSGPAATIARVPSITADLRNILKTFEYIDEKRITTPSAWTVLLSDSVVALRQTRARPRILANLSVQLDFQKEPCANSLTPSHEPILCH